MEKEDYFILPFLSSSSSIPTIAVSSATGTAATAEVVYVVVGFVVVRIEEVNDYHCCTTIGTSLTAYPTPSFQSLSIVKEANDVAVEFDFAFAPPPLFTVACENDEIDIIACISLVVGKCYLPSLAVATPILDFSPSIFIAIRQFTISGEERIVGKEKKIKIFYFSLIMSFLISNFYLKKPVLVDFQGLLAFFYA